MVSRLPPWAAHIGLNEGAEEKKSRKPEEVLKNY
jgi:hypothetical protein